MTDINIAITRDEKVDTMHQESQKWISNICFVDNEVVFIKQLLNSYVFQPDTPDLFKKSQEFIDHIVDAEKGSSEVKECIISHEKSLGGMLECTDEVCDLTYFDEHNKVRKTVLNYVGEFQKLKTEIFAYAGTILKKRKK